MPVARCVGTVNITGYTCCMNNETIRDPSGKRNGYHRENLRQELLDRGLALLARDGLAGFSLRALAKELGVSHTAPYRHFSTREQLLSEIVRESMNRFEQALMASIMVEGDDKETSTDWAKRMYDFISRIPKFFRCSIFYPARSRARRTHSSEYSGYRIPGTMNRASLILIQTGDSGHCVRQPPRSFRSIPIFRSAMSCSVSGQKPTALPVFSLPIPTGSHRRVSSPVSHASCETRFKRSAASKLLVNGRDFSPHGEFLVRPVVNFYGCYNPLYVTAQRVRVHFSGYRKQGIHGIRFHNRSHGTQLVRNSRFIPSTRTTSAT